MYDIIVLGTGGTGTFFMKELSRFLYENTGSIGSMYCIDGDRVEHKNIERQSFQEEDIGLSKAAVMASVLNETFNLRWKAIDAYITKAEEIEKLFNRTPIIVGCVDNHAARLVLEKVFRNRKDIYYLDSANEFSSGEVVFSVMKNGRCLSPVRSHYFKDILKGDLRNVTEMSCEELNNASPQHIATNMLAGNILLSEVCNILNDTPHYGFVTFDAENFSSEFYPYEGKKRRAA